jgi:fluoride exporter
MARFLWVCAAGGVGTGARYLLSGWLQRKLGPSFPFGTLAVNVVGCFLLGAVMQVSLSTRLVPADVRVVIAIGLLGGFTTYSTFNYETLAFFREGAWALGLATVLVTVIGCLAAGLTGIAGARWLIGN